MHALRRRACCGASFAPAQLAAALLAATLLLAPAREARAHPPLRASSVVWGSGDAFTVRTNRGLVFVQGGRARLLCPMAIGAFPTEQLPLIASQRAGWLVGTSNGIVALDERGCREPGPLPSSERGVQDLVASADGTRLAAVTADASAGSALLRSADGGASFERTQLLAEREFFNSVVMDAAGSVLYLAGERIDATNQVSHFFAVVSADAEFSLHPFELEPGEVRLRVLAVDPVHPEVVVAGAFGAADAAVPSRLLRSEDAGHGWRTWQTLPGLNQFEFSSDGSTAWVASEAGLWRSDAGGAFAHLPLERAPSCAVPSAGGLVICDALGLQGSPDGVDAFAPLLRFADVTAPVSCDGSAAAVLECRADWEEFAAEQARVFFSAPAGAESAPGAASAEPSGARGMPAQGAAASSACAITPLRSARGGAGRLAGALMLALGALRRVRGGGLSGSRCGARSRTRSTTWR